MLQVVDRPVEVLLACPGAEMAIKTQLLDRPFLLYRALQIARRNKIVPQTVSTTVADGIAQIGLTVSGQKAMWKLQTQLEAAWGSPFYACPARERRRPHTPGLLWAAEVERVFPPNTHVLVARGGAYPGAVAPSVFAGRPELQGVLGTGDHATWIEDVLGVIGHFGGNFVHVDGSARGWENTDLVSLDAAFSISFSRWTHKKELRTALGQLMAAHEVTHTLWDFSTPD